MPKNNYLRRKDRLDQLMGLLSSREVWTINNLSLALNVSSRTLARDLADLEASGVAIESDRGRGGGVQLHKNWGLGKLQLNHGEIADLLLALATMEKLKSPLLMGNLRSIRFKISQSFPPEQRPAVEELRKRIFIGETASKIVLSNYLPPKTKPMTFITTALTNAFFDKKCLRISYVAEDGEKTKRKIEPHFLLYNWPVWYIQAWCHLRQAVRFFRIDRISWAVLEAEKFTVRHDDFFKQYTEEFFESI